MHDHVLIRLLPDTTTFAIGECTAVHVIVANWWRCNNCNPAAVSGSLWPCTTTGTTATYRWMGQDAAYKLQHDV